MKTDMIKADAYLPDNDIKNQTFTCPFCHGTVSFYNEPNNEQSRETKDKFRCPNCDYDVNLESGRHRFTIKELKDLFNDGYLFCSDFISKSGRQFAGVILLLFNNKRPIILWPLTPENQKKYTDLPVLKHLPDCTNKDNSKLFVNSDAVWCPECKKFEVYGKNNCINTGLSNTIQPSLRRYYPKVNPLLARIDNMANAQNSVTDSVYDLFISHKSSDTPVIEPILKSLSSSSYKYWFDRDGGINPGNDYTGEILRGIGSSKIFLLMVSSEALSSKEVMKEVAYAYNKFNKYIFVISLDSKINENNLVSHVNSEYQNLFNDFIWLGHADDLTALSTVLKFINQNSLDVFFAYAQENKANRKRISSICSHFIDKGYFCWSLPFDNYRELSKLLINTAKSIISFISSQSNRNQEFQNLIAKVTSASNKTVNPFVLDQNITVNDLNPGFGFNTAIQLFTPNDPVEKLSDYLEPLLYSYEVFVIQSSSENDYKTAAQIAADLELSNWCRPRPLVSDSKTNVERANAINDSKLYLAILTEECYRNPLLLEEISREINLINTNNNEKERIIYVSTPNWKSLPQISEKFEFQTSTDTWIYNDPDELHRKIRQKLANFKNTAKKPSVREDSSLTGTLSTHKKTILTSVSLIAGAAALFGLFSAFYASGNNASNNKSIDRLIEQNEIISEIDTRNFGVGTIIRFGTYWNKPLYWIYAFDDPDGNQIFVAKDLITFKPFDVAHSNQYGSDSKKRSIEFHPRVNETIKSYVGRLSTDTWIGALGENSWENSTLRAWLNSDNIVTDYPGFAPNNANINSDSAMTYGVSYTQRLNEPGFLTGFTADEINLLKPRKTEVILSGNRKNEATEGRNLFNFFKELDPDRDLYKTTFVPKIKPYVFDLKDLYKKKIEDHVFIPSLEDFLEISKDPRIAIEYSKEVFTPNGESYFLPSSTWWLNTPCGFTVTTVCTVTSSDFNKDKPLLKVTPASDVMGVRPMIKIAARNLKFKGSGTAADPYYIE
ncbi:MAG: toll/interleukin-1 receptor domain-containing protein [Succinivibrionaceae bacterium]|nr:toll/interleukin-1 receptor domain-containing protein [Succinivibrionaceae bacterium]